MHTEHSVIIILACAFAVGCNPRPFEEEEALIVAEAVVAELDGDVSAVKWDEPARVGQFGVYVDRSLTMRPYLSAPNSTYRQLISSLADRFAGDVNFYGFGYPPGASEQGVGPAGRSELLEAAAYDRVNNDYASLFASFATDPARPRLVVTDGVQSDRETRGQFGPIVESVNRWLAGGGSLAVLLYRTPYEGTYYSETDGSALRYSCNDRPLVVFAFLPSTLSLDDVLGPLGEGVQPAHVVELGQRGLPMTPEEQSVEAGSAGRVLRDVSEVVLRGYDQVFQARVVDRAQDGDGFVPFGFVAEIPDEQPWTSLSGTERVRVLEGLEPQLRVWAIGGDRDTLMVTEVDPFVDLDRVTVEAESDTSGTRLRVQVPVRRPDADTRRFALALSLRPGSAAAYAMVPDGFTTADDAAPSACGRTLNLGPLVGTVIRGSYVAGRSVVLTEWRGR